jgi:hypothetical protein
MVCAAENPGTGSTYSGRTFSFTKTRCTALRTRDVDSGGVPQLQIERLDNPRNGFEIGASDGCINIPRQPGGERINSVHVQVDSQPADDPVVDSRLRHGGGKTACELDQLFHMLFIMRVDQHLSQYRTTVTRLKPSAITGGTSLAAILRTASSGTTRVRLRLRARQISRGTSKNSASI